MVNSQLKIFLSAVAFISGSFTICIPAYSQEKSPIQTYIDSIYISTDNETKVNHINTVIAHFDSTNSPNEIRYLKQFISIYQGMANYKEEANTLSKLANTFSSLGEYDSVIIYANKAISIYETLGLEKEAIPALHTKARAYNSKTDFPKALKIHSQIMSFYKKQNDSFEKKYRFITGQHLNIALAMYEMGYYDIATEYTIKSLKLIEANKEWGNALKCYALKVMGMISLKNGDNEKALKYFFEVADMLRVSDEKNMPKKNKISEYISQTYYEMGNYKTALKYIIKAYNESIENGIDKDAGIALNYAGEIYLKLENYQLADQYFQNALQYFQKGTTHKYIAITKLNIVKSYNAQGKKEGIISLLTDALIESKTAKSKPVTKDCYDLLAKFYIENNQPTKAYEYSRLHNDLSYSLLNETKAKKIEQLQLNYEIKREVLEANYQLEKKSIEAKIKSQDEKRLYITIIVVLIIFTLIIFIWKEGEKARRKASELSHKIKEETDKHRIEQLVKDQEIDNIRANLNGQEKERKRIAKELHDGVGGSLAAIKILIQKMDNGNNQMFTKASSRLDQVCEEVRTISHHLTPPFLYHSSFIAVIEQFALDISNTHRLNVTVRCFEKETVNAFNNDLKTDIYRMIQELTHNAVKHAAAENISIQLSVDGEYFSLMVEDDGKGISNLNDAKGIGLSNLELRVSALDGTLDIDSAIGEGTLVSVHIKMIPTTLTTEHG